jgi:preprotein translocase subunit YajC
MLNRLFQNVPGIQIYGIFVLLLFIITFIVIVIRVWRTDKKYLKKMSELPLDQKLTRGEESRDRK